MRLNVFCCFSDHLLISHFLFSDHRIIIHPLELLNDFERVSNPVILISDDSEYELVIKNIRKYNVLTPIYLIKDLNIPMSWLCSFALIRYLFTIKLIRKTYKFICCVFSIILSCRSKILYLMSQKPPMPLTIQAIDLSQKNVPINGVIHAADLYYDHLYCLLTTFPQQYIWNYVFEMDTFFRSKTKLADAST